LVLVWRWRWKACFSINWLLLALDAARFHFVSYSQNQLLVYYRPANNYLLPKVSMMGDYFQHFLLFC
jgi:hypothetical protein